MNKIRLLANVTIVCIILMIAVYLPNIVSSYLQKSLEDKVSYIDVGVKTYEVKYNNIWEKLVSIKKCVVEDGELKTVPIATEITEELKENLTQKVTQQISKIQSGIVYNFSEVSKDDLVSCEKYAIYSSSEANGISFWKLKYQTRKEIIQILMDTEFEYIYMINSKLLKNEDAETVIKKCISTQDTLLDHWITNLYSYLDILTNKKIDSIIPDIVNYMDGSFLLFCKLYYEDATDQMPDETRMDDGSSVSSSGYKIYKKYVDIIDEYDGEQGKNEITIFCIYDWDTEQLSFIWGFSFFYDMMQL